MRFIQKLKNKKGFTLVELIVVIVIIAILAAVAVPLLTKYIGEAQTSSDVSTYGNIQTAITTAQSAIESPSNANSFLDELKILLPAGANNQFTFKTGTATSIVIQVGNDATKTITLAGTGFDAADAAGKQAAVPNITATTFGAGWSTPPAPTPAP